MNSPRSTRRIPRMRRSGLGIPNVEPPSAWGQGRCLPLQSDQCDNVRAMIRCIIILVFFLWSSVVFADRGLAGTSSLRVRDHGVRLDPFNGRLGAVHRRGRCKGRECLTRRRIGLGPTRPASRGAFSFVPAGLTAHIQYGAGSTAPVVRLIGCKPPIPALY